MNILQVMYDAEYILRCTTKLKKYGRMKIKKRPCPIVRQKALSSATMLLNVRN